MVARSVLSCVIATLLVTTAVAGQTRADSSVPLWPAGWDAAVASGLLDAEQQRRLPIYDDAGQVIPFAEVEARVKPPGSAGLWGLTVGVVAGFVIGAGISNPDCNVTRGNLRIHCSPREEALQTWVPLGLAITLGAGGMWAFTESSRVTWDEAVAKIRAERAGR